MSTREEILQLGEHLMRMQGFNAFSYYHLAEQLHLRPAAVHYHFPSKDSLALAVITQAREDFFAFCKETDKMPKHVDRLKKFVHSFSPHAASGKICMVGATGADFHSFSEEVQTAVTMMVKDILSWLSRLLRDGRKKGEFVFRGDPRARAMMVSTNMAASLHMARILGKKEHQLIADQLVDDLTGEKMLSPKSSNKRKQKTK